MFIEEKISAKISVFFDLVNDPIIQNYYIIDIYNWDALCASLHLIRDIQRAKLEYQKLSSINHLETIGIMQSIYIEQDCVQTLRNSILEIKSKSFNFTLTKYENIRVVRNKIFGHPSNKKTGRINTRHFFDIINSKEQVLKHIFWGTDKKIESEIFGLKNLVTRNSEITLSYLSEIENDFKNKFKKIMSKYGINFKDIFKEAFYAFPKILTKENDLFIIDHYYDSMIENLIKNLKKGLKERNLYKDYEKDIKVIEFLNSKLTPLFYNQTYKDVEFYAYASSLNNIIRELAENLSQIDEVFNE